MIKTILILISITISQEKMFASDSTLYSCKYRYEWQKDSKDTNSKFDDVMIVSISKNTTLYYSYLKHFGNRNRELDKINKKKNENLTVTGNMVTINKDSRNSGTYFSKNESEILKINYLTKVITVADRLLIRTYGYEAELIKPTWKIETDTMTILNQICQKATTIFKGRNYTAWFANSIPYKYGPWLFNSLPGLILKVEDDKKQFKFECIELNTPTNSTKVFQEYNQIKIISRKQLMLKKKFYYEDIVGFMEAEEGITITSTDSQTGNFVQRKLKSYNSIELSEN